MRPKKWPTRENRSAPSSQAPSVAADYARRSRANIFSYFSRITSQR